MRKQYKLLPPIIPSAKIDKEFRTALFALIDQMQRSVEWYCKAALKPVEKENEKLGFNGRGSCKQPTKGYTRG